MRQTFAEDLAWARRIPASEAADSNPQLDRNTLPWQVLQPTEIATVSRVRAFSAYGQRGSCSTCTISRNWSGSSRIRMSERGRRDYEWLGGSAIASQL